MQRQVKLLYWTVNKLGGAFSQCSIVVKNPVWCLLHSTMCLSIVMQRV